MHERFDCGLRGVCAFRRYRPWREQGTGRERERDVYIYIYIYIYCYIYIYIFIAHAEDVMHVSSPLPRLDDVATYLDQMLREAAPQGLRLPIRV